MKILMLTPSYDPIIGGTETVVKNLAINLNKIGVETDVMTFNMDKKWEPTWKWKIREEDGLEVYRIPAFNPFKKIPNPVGYSFKINVIPALSFRKIMNDYDVLHFHDDVDLTFPLFCSFIKMPKVFQYHTLPYTHQFYRKSIPCKCILKSCMDHHICSSRSALEMLIDIGIDERKIAVIPNAVDLNKFHSVNAEELCLYEKDMNIDSKSKKIVCISRLSPEKLNPIVSAINAMPKVIHEIPDTKMIIVGNGSSFDYVKDLAKRINRQLNRDAIIVTGALDSNYMHIIMNLADVVIGAGQIPVEAMACGKPTIVAGHIIGPFGGNFGGIATKENIDDLKDHNFSGRNSMVKMNPDKIAEAVIKLLVNDNYRQSIGEFGRKFVENERDIHKIVRQLEMIYHNLLN